jgi:trigger factor
VPTPNIDGLELERLTVEPSEAAIDEQLQRLVQSNKGWTDAPKGQSARQGDLVVVDFEGRVNDELFEGGTGEDMSVELGSGRLIPGFEEQLVGAKAGESRDVKVTFPKDYPTASLKGKAAVFAVTVKAVKVPGEAKADDEFARSLGLNDLNHLRGLLRDQLAQELNGLTRTHMKRRLLDQLAERSDFPVPDSMVEAEYQAIMQQLRHEAGHEEDPQAALAEIETDAGEYRKIAERRVRLGLVLSEIGAANGIEVSQQEMNQLIAQAASQYQPHDRDRFIQYVQQEPAAAAQLRAPLYEDKVVDFLFSKARITDRTATREQLEADLESEEGHVHGPGCGHDHQPSAKPRTARASKAAAKPAKAETKPAASKVKLAAEADEKPKPAKPLKSEPANKPVPGKAEGAAAAKGEKATAKPAAKKPAKKAK